MRKQLYRKKGNNKSVKILPTEYASFRDWVREYFIEEVLPYSNTFLDPWAGTAPLAPNIELAGKTAYFNDFSPVHYIVNKAKSYSVFFELLETNQLTEDFLTKKAFRCMAPLNSVKRSISDKLINDDILEYFLTAWSKAESYDQALQTFLKAIIMLCVRSLSNFVKSSSHPNWLKKGGRAGNVQLKDVILLQVQKLLKYYTHSYQNKTLPKKIGNCKFYCEDAINLDFRKKFDVIFTSPSYRNSTDLYNMFLPELYFLNNIGFEIEPSKFIGTNMVKGYNNEIFQEDLAFIKKVSPKTKKFIDRVFSVQSEKSNYYPRVYTRHYARLFKSMRKFLTFLAPNGFAYFIVQTNFHRGGLNEMGDFLVDFFHNIGWKAEITGIQYYNHNGKRNISKKFPICPDKVPEHIVRVYK